MIDCESQELISFRKRDQAKLVGRIIGKLAGEAVVSVAITVASVGAAGVRAVARETYYTFPNEIDKLDRVGKVWGGFIRGIGEGFKVAKKGSERIRKP